MDKPVKVNAKFILIDLSAVLGSSFFAAVLKQKVAMRSCWLLRFMDSEMLLSSSCRRRILRVLSRNGRVNVMELVRKVNSTYNQVNSSLQILKKEQIIFDEHYGRMRRIWLNRENPRTTLLLQALRILEKSKS